jgi:D-tyrosyl-tRNA(Tyr) deacylase
MARKVLNLRIWPGEKPWSLSVVQRELELLVISQFTLHAVLKGNRPDFHHAMEPIRAREFFDSFVEMLRSAYVPERVQTGSFGAYMEVNAKVDGPVTITLDTQK